MAAKTDRRPALGRGLSALIPDSPQAPAPPAAAPRDTPYEVDLDLLEPNPQQPRQSFDDASLDELAASIRVHGLVQPIVVRRRGQRFEIVAGERRWRASQRAGLLKVPVVVRVVQDEHLLQVALIENIQREDLNPIDEALAYQQLTRDYGLTQEEVAGAVGKDRASVANHLRLLKLPEAVRKDVASGRLSMGHAKVLLGLEDPATIASAAADVQRKALSVRETEALVKRLQQPAQDAPPPAPKDVHTREAEERLRVALGTRVGITRKGKGGRIEIEFVNEQELIRLYDLFVGSS